MSGPLPTLGNWREEYISQQLCPNHSTGLWLAHSPYRTTTSHRWLKVSALLQSLSLHRADPVYHTNTAMTLMWALTSYIVNIDMLEFYLTVTLENFRILIGSVFWKS